MDKKVWIALILSVVVIFFYPYLIKWYYPQQEPVAVQQAPIDAAAPAAQQGATGAASREAMPAPVAEELTTVETPLYKAVFTNAGGAIKSLELKNYQQGPERPCCRERRSEGRGA